MKATINLSLSLLILLAACVPSWAQTPAQTAEEEAVRREEAKINLRRTIADAQAAQDNKNVPVATRLSQSAKLYEDAYVIARSVGVGIDKETQETVDGLTSVRLKLAELAQRHGDLAEADAQVKRILVVNPGDTYSQNFKWANDKLLEAQKGNIPSKEMIALIPEFRNDGIKTSTLVQDGKLLYEMRKFDEAEAKLKQATRQDPANRPAFYYLALISEARYSEEARKREISAKNAIVDVEKAWNPPTTRERLPVPNPFATTNLTHTSVGRSEIQHKLDIIKVEQVFFQALPLPEVLKYLDEQARKRDPDQKGINFMVNPNAEASASGGAGTIDPQTGQIVPAPAPEPLDMSSVLVKIDPPLRNVSLSEVLQAITIVADHPLKYSIEDYAVVFSQKTADAAHLFTRFYKVNPNTFIQGLIGVYSLPFGNVSTSGGQGGAGGGGGGGGAGGAGGTSIFSVPAIDVTGNGGQYSVGGVGGGGGGGGGGGIGGVGGGTRGLPGVINTNLTVRSQDLVRDFFTAAGLNLGPPNALFFNDRSGLLMVRATMQELDIVQQAIETLNETPAEITIEAKFAEISQIDSKALGFDWYLGNVAMSGGALGLQGGTAPSYNGAPTVANPSGVFPGTFGTPSVAPNFGSDQLLTSGLRNTTGDQNSIPTVGTLTGILTDPQFRMVVRALQQRGGVDLLSAPKVTTVSGRQAQIQVVDIQTIVTGLNTTQTATAGGALGGTGGAVAPSQNYTTQPLPFGPSLDIIPYLSSDGYTIQMTLLPSFSEFIGYDNPGQFVPEAIAVAGNTVGLPITAQLPLPHFRARTITTSAIVWDGQTVVLGGLISENVTKIKDQVPVLGDIPFLGRFFRSEATTATKKNLLVFVTPNIIDPAGNYVHNRDNLPYDPQAIPPQKPITQ